MCSKGGSQMPYSLVHENNNLRTLSGERQVQYFKTKEIFHKKITKTLKKEEFFSRRIPNIQGKCANNYEAQGHQTKKNNNQCHSFHQLHIVLIYRSIWYNTHKDMAPTSKAGNNKD